MNYLAMEDKPEGTNSQTPIRKIKIKKKLQKKSKYYILKLTLTYGNN